MYADGSAKLYEHANSKLEAFSSARTLGDLWSEVRRTVIGKLPPRKWPAWTTR